MSVIISYSTGIFRQVDNFSLSLETTPGKNLAARLKKNCTSYLLSYESRTCSALATWLDPRFKDTAFMSQTRAEQAVTNLKALLKELYDAEMAKGPVLFT